jgi:hypothetical protein
MTMVIHDRVADVRGVGKWDFTTGRYIPVSGGSRSRLPLYDDKNYPRYTGYVGVDEHLSAEMYTMPALYTFLGGAAVIAEGHGSVFTKLIQEQGVARLKAEDEDAKK